MHSRAEAIHVAISAVFAIAVPLAIFLINDRFEPWTLIFGVFSGFTYWYFFDPLP